MGLYQADCPSLYGACLMKRPCPNRDATSDFLCVNIQIHDACHDRKYTHAYRAELDMMPGHTV